MRQFLAVSVLLAPALFVSCVDETPVIPPLSEPALVPLEVGDIWVYSAADPNDFGAFVDQVTEVREIGGRVYHRIEGDILGSVLSNIGEGSGWIRFDHSRLLVLLSEQGAEKALFDLDQLPGEAWTIDGRRVLREENEIRIRVPFGFFDDIPNFIYDADSKGRWTILLKPGVGVVRATAGSSADSRVFEFRKGTVGGELVR